MPEITISLDKYSLELLRMASVDSGKSEEEILEEILMQYVEENAV